MPPVNLGINFSGDAKAAADSFLMMLNKQAVGIAHLGEEITKFNSKGDTIAQIFRGLGTAGEKLEVALKMGKNGFELISGSTDKAAESLRKYKEQQAEILAAQRRNQANAAESTLRDSLTGGTGAPVGGTAQQASAMEAVFQRVRAAIESGSVSLTRFRQIYDQLQANPKAIIPNLTAEEARVASAIRTVMGGFDQMSEKAKTANSRLTSMLSFVGRIFSSQVIGRITGFLSQSFDEGIVAAKEFSLKVAEIQTISQTANMSTEQWSSGLRALSSQFGNSQADVAEAAYQSLSNQITKGADTFEFLSASAKFSQAAVTSLADAVNLGSSAIKSFNIPVGDADKIFASFFKTIELGRLRAKDISDTFGRVAGVASQVGVSLNEVNAALATITNRGIQPAEAMTLINNIMLKLIRPTDEMKKLFDEWGVASGTAAIQTFGFAGVLQKLEVEAQKGGTRLGDLFNQIRAVRGAFALSGSGFADFTANLEAIENAKDGYDRAAQIVSRSFGQRFKVEMNKVAVFFTEEFGDQIVKGTVQLADRFGGLDTVVRTLTTGVIALAKAGSVYLGIQIAVAAASYNGSTAAMTQASSLAALTAASTTATAAERARAEATIAANASMASLNVAIAGFSLGVFIAQWFELGRAIEGVVAQQERWTEEAKKIDKTVNIMFQGGASKDRTTQSFTADVAAVRSSFDARYKLSLTYYSNQQKLSQQLKERTTQHLKDTTDATKIAAKGFFDSFTKNLSDLRKVASEAEQIIKDSLKTSEGLTRKTTDEIFSKRLGFASEGQIDESGFVMGEQKTALIKSRIAELQDLADKKFKEGTQESVADARKLYDEIRTQQGALLDATVSKQRKEFDEAVRRGQVAPTSTTFDPVTGQMKQRFEFVVRTAEFERQITATKNQQLAAEEKLRQAQKERLADAEEEEKREKEKLRTVQQAFDAINKINILDKEGKVKEEFKDTKLKLPGEKEITIPGGLKALEEFDRQADVIRKAAAEKDLSTQAAVNSALVQQRQALVQQIEAVSTDARIRGEAERLGVAKKATDDELTNIEQKFAAGNERITAGIKDLEANLRKIVNQDVSNPTVLENLGGIFDLKNRTKKKNAPETVAAVGEVQAAARAASIANQEFFNDRSPEKLAELQKAVEKFKDSYKDYVKVLTGGKETVDSLAESPAVKRFQEAIKGFEGIQSGLRERSGAADMLETANRASKSLGGTLAELPNALRIFEQTSAESAPIVTSSLSQITDSTNQLVSSLQQAVETLRRLNEEVPQLRQGLGGGEALAQHDRFGGPVRYLSGGGLVGFKPRGSDTVPAMLDPNEFVMTSQATKHFEPVLRAMNAMSPQYMAKGGSPVNVGDVNVTVNGGNTAPDIIRHVAKGLRRGIKNKTIKLN